MPGILEQFYGSINIAQFLPEEILNKVGDEVYREYEIDKESRSDWEKDIEFAMELATQAVEQKNEPFEGAANIKYPTVAMASVQFAARALPQIIKDADVVKAKVIGKDPGGIKAEKAQHINLHMSWQLLHQMDNWVEDLDYLLTALPIEGVEFKKTYFDPARKKNVSQWVKPKDLVVNFNYRFLDDAPRVTHIIRLLPHKIVERIRSGVFLDQSEILGQPMQKDEDDAKFDSRDEFAPRVFLEQHRFLDLDQDGYHEPYIVTIHRDTRKVVRIFRRWDEDGIMYNDNGQVLSITPVHYFTAFQFMPCPKGSVYGMGYGRLLGPLNTSINMTLNQIHDAGTLANTQGGFMGRAFTIGKGRQQKSTSFKMGEFKSVSFSGDDIRKAILPLPFKGPDVTLFQLLGLLIETGEKLGSVTDPIMGESPGTNVPATTTLALIEQGSKVFSSVFKRIHKSLKKEFDKLFRLNSLFLDQTEYFTVLDTEYAIAQTDYDLKTFDVQPVSDPNMISDTQMLVKAEVLKEFLGQGLDDAKIMSRILEAMRIPNWQELIPDEPKEQEPDPKTVVELLKLDIERDRLDMQMFKTQFEVLKLQAESIKLLAEAGTIEGSQELEAYKSQMELLTKHIELRMKEKELKLKEKEGEKKDGTAK